MSLHKNEILKQILIVILCAGRGQRYNRLTQRVPKPLIRVKSLDNKPIIYNTISNLINLNFTNIRLVTGYLGHQIRDYIANLKTEFETEQSALKTVDSNNQYIKGPLYSFLSVYREVNLDSYSLILALPGDTVFDFQLLESVKQIVVNNFRELKKTACVFYREIEGEVFPLEWTVVEVEQTEKGNLLKQINKISIKSHKGQKVNQMIPASAFSSRYIDYITKNRDKFNATSIWEVVNKMVKSGLLFFSFAISAEYQFYDIDSELDLFNVESKKKEGQ